MAQAYMYMQVPEIAGLAAREVREAIARSDLSDTPISQDHIELLRRIEGSTLDDLDRLVRELGCG